MSALPARNNGWIFDFTLFYKLFIVSTSSIKLGVIDVHTRARKKTQIRVQRLNWYKILYTNILLQPEYQTFRK